MHHDASGLGGGVAVTLAELSLLRGAARGIELLAASSSPRRFLEEAARIADEVHVYDPSPFRAAWRFMGVPLLGRLAGLRALEAAGALADLARGFDVLHVHGSVAEPAFIPRLVEAGEAPLLVKTVHDSLYVCPLRTLPGSLLGRSCRGFWRDGCWRCCLAEAWRLGGADLLVRAARNVVRMEPLARLLRLYDVVAAPSMFMHVMLEGLGLRRLVLLRNPAPPGLWEARERLRASPKGDYLLYLGRLSREKGLDVVLELARRARGLRVVVAGAGPMERVVEGFAQRGLVRYVGYVAGNEKYRLLAGARALLFPSRTAENAPMSIVEALCVGTPVLAFDVGGQGELIRLSGAGWLARPYVVEDFVARAVEAFEAGLSPGVREAAAAWCDGQHSPRLHLERLLELYGLGC